MKHLRHHIITMLVALCGLTVGAADAEARFKVPAKVKTEGFTGPVHKKHQGLVVFSKRPIARAPSNDKALIHQFSLKDPIHMRAFMKDSYFNLLVDRSLQYRSTSPYSSDRFSFKIQVEGQKKWHTLTYIRPGEGLIKESTAFALGHDPKTSLTAKAKWGQRQDASTAFVNHVLPLLKPGANTLTVAFVGQSRAYGKKGYADPKVTLASGSFTLNIKPGEIKSFIKSHGPRLPKSKHRQDKKLRKLYKKTIEREWKKETYIGSVTTSDKWHVKLHRFHGRPTERTVSAIVVLKREGHEHCRAFDLTFAQAYAGRGKKFHKHMRIYVGGNKRFPCENAPKR